MTTDVQPSIPAARTVGAKKKVIVLVAIVAAIALIAVYVDTGAYFAWVETKVAQLGFWGPFLLIAVYVVATVFFVPGSPLTVLAGGLFGVGWGSVYVSIGSTLGATLAFVLGRTLMRDFIAKKIEGKQKFSAIDEAVAREGWKIVGLTRLSPAFPFNLLNYAYGLTKVKLWHYVLASWIGMMPGTVLYVYLGAVGKAAADSQGRTPLEWAGLAVGFIAAVAVTVYVTKLARRALGERLEDSSGDAGADAGADAELNAGAEPASQ